jgi:hypothetical protein
MPVCALHGRVFLLNSLPQGNYHKGEGMKRFVAPMVIGACLATSAVASQEMQAQLEEMKKQIAELKAAQESINVDALQRQLNEVRAHSAGDNIKFDMDFRTAYDIVDYKVNGGDSVDNAIWTNKMILGMAAQPREDLVFRGSIGVYKAFGNNSSFGANGYQNMDWFATQTPGDSILRLREAYFLYMGDFGDLSYTASFGRRPSVDGFLTNLRANNADPASPVGHNINMEFDGASFMFDVEKITGVSGMYFKLCLGRGNSNADAKYPGFTGYPIMGGMTPSATYAPYSKSNFDSPNMDLAGLLMQLYDDGQYKVMANIFKGWNMMGANFGYYNENNATNGYSVGMTDVGDMTGGSLSLQVSGLSYDNDFLMNTTVFASYAFSKTDPKGSHSVIDPNTGNVGPMTEMLGSPDSETGHSYYVGAQIPGFFENDKIGFEYNHGSKYWRSFTYGEDTLVGSKLATRGDAYEMYYNLPVLGKNLTAQMRYTYIDYDYTGSDMFFGSTGAPQDVDKTPGAVETAQNIHLSLRYRY